MTGKPTSPAASRTLDRPDGRRFGLSFLLLAAAVLLALTLVGCQGQMEREPEEVGVEPGVAAVDDPVGLTTEGMPAAGDATATGQPAMPPGGGPVVTVNLHGRQIDMPRTIELPRDLPAGEVTFSITNTGDMEHNFEIEGNGIERMLDTPLQPGESGTLTVSLQPGTYTVYCPVANHADEGMKLELEVTQ